MLLKEALTKYLNYLKQKNYTARTIETYSQRLKKFLLFLYNNGIQKVKDITKDLLKNYLSDRHYHLNQNGKQNQARYRSYERQTLKLFFIFLFEIKELNENLAEAIDTVKIPRLTIPKDSLTKKELMGIFSRPDIATNQGYRDRTALEILYATGIRHQELNRLKLEDINFKERTIFIESGKGQKDRVVPINETALKFVRHYISEIRSKLKLKNTPDTTLILSLNGKSFKARKLGQQLVTPYLKHLRKKKKITPYSFRRTFATHLIQAGCPLRHVQELLGHNDLNTTVKYLQLDIRDLQKEYRKTHPMEREFDTS